MVTFDNLPQRSKTQVLLLPRKDTMCKYFSSYSAYSLLLLMNYSVIMACPSIIPCHAHYTADFTLKFKHNIHMPFNSLETSLPH